MPAANRYHQLRQQLLDPTAEEVALPLREADGQYLPVAVSERLLQCIWYDQRVATDTLQTTDGRPVQVISPGWWNLEAGPDFRNATIQIGAEPERSGDVEIHLRASDWRQHGHQNDPCYNNVILHVALRPEGTDTPVRTQRGDIVPQLILQDQLAAPLEQLHDEIELENYPHNARGHAGHCATTLSRLRADSIRELLNAAGQQRFAEKKRKFARWISQRGAAQAFYEGWMEALGYKANKTPFRMLAQRLPLSEAVELREQLPAVLFGLANFLPTQAASGLARRLWQVWWQVRPQYEDRQLPPHAWRLHGVRPANHPQRRLGLAVTLLQRYPQLLDNMVGAVQSHGNPEKLFLELYEPFWSTHYTLGGRQQRRPIALLGPSRVRELVANVVLPFIAAHAELSGDAGLCAKAATQFATLPAAPGNSLMRLAAQQLFGTSKATGLVKTSLQQQGLLQIFQDFCLQDKSACQRCLFPELVLRWTRSNG